MFRAGNQPGLDCRLPKGNEQIPNDLEIRFFVLLIGGLEWACLAGLRLGPAYSFLLESRREMSTGVGRRRRDLRAGLPARA